MTEAFQNDDGSEWAGSASKVKANAPLSGEMITLEPLTAALLESITPADVVTAVVERGVAVLGAEAGLVVLVQEDQVSKEEYLHIVGARGYAEEVLGAWQRFPLTDPLPVSDAVREQRPLFSTGRADLEARYPEMFERGPVHQIKASVSLPLVARRRSMGGLHFSFPEERDTFTETDRAFLLELARQCALALDRALLLEGMGAARQHQEFLAQASALLGESLDYQRTLEAIARLAVPNLCDWAAVDMVDPSNENGQLLHLAVAHTDPDEVAWVRQAQRRYPVNMTQAGQPVVQAISTGKTVFLPNIPEEVLLAVAQDAEHLRLIKRLDLRSYLCVPLTARGRTLGAVAFAATRASGRVFTPETVALVEELARRAAVAVDNARLFEQAQQEIAERRQAERERAGSEERFRALADNIAQLAWMADASGAIFWYNRRWFEYTGTTLEEMLGWAWRKVHHPDFVEGVTEKFRKSVEAGEPWEDTFPLRGADGEYRWFLSRAFPTRDNAGNVVLWCGTNTDVTEQREASVRQRRFLREMLLGFTEGRLRLCDSASDLPQPLLPLSSPVKLTRETMRRLRQQVVADAEALQLPLERLQDFETAVGEASMNAVQHGRGGNGRVHGDPDSGVIQVWIEDQGDGIAEDFIHRAIEQGWTTGGFGQGFFLMRSCADRIYLLTGPTGTTVVLEQEQTPPVPSWFK